MKIGKRWFVLPAFLSCCLLVFCFNSSAKSNIESNYANIVQRVHEILLWRHYSPKPVNDSFSENVFDRYLLNLDPNKRFFTQLDIEAFNEFQDSLDDHFQSGEMGFFQMTVDTLYNRTNALSEMVNEILEKPLDFSTKTDSIDFNVDKIAYAENFDQMKERWIKHLKYNVLQEIRSLKEEEDLEKGTKETSFKKFEKMAREEVQIYMSDFFRRFKRRKKKDWLSIYINSFTEEYDPHTTYFSPKEKENFDFNISGQLEGIGARLQDKRGYATILELIVGGPAWKSGQLEVGDQILKVNQGKDGKPVNIVGMLLDDAIRLIRGKKGSIVVLTIKKVDGTTIDVEIERDIIEFEDAFARSVIIEKEDGKRYGLIYLPEFYANFKNRKNGSDASNDVLFELIELNKENLDGLVFDVRDNGGGSLQEVVEIAGLFIKDGPIVQVQSTGKKIKVHEDNDKGIYWEGPMVVMVNELSASASEILAAALQDYNRAVILGSKKTYGKGTVQSLYPLSSFLNNSSDFGSLKLTIQKFYRINGESTQLKGVESDIAIPGKYSVVEVSESDQDNPLPWDRIEGLNYQLWKENDIETAVENSEKRLENSDFVEILQQNALSFKKISDQKKVSLEYKAFFEEIERRDKELDNFEALKDYSNGFTFMSPKHESERFEIDSTLRIKRENWHKDLEKDFYLNEAIEVLKDL